MIFVVYAYCIKYVNKISDKNLKRNKIVNVRDVLSSNPISRESWQVTPSVINCSRRSQMVGDVPSKLRGKN